MCQNESASAFVAWLRIAPGPWTVVAQADSYAEAAEAADAYLAGMEDPPKHCESFIGRQETPPPTPRARRCSYAR